MIRAAATVVLGIAMTALSPAVGTASAAESVTCGNYWTQGAPGQWARDYHWGNCGSAATKIDIIGVAYGIQHPRGEQCVPAGTAVLIGQTGNHLVYTYKAVDTQTAC
ncbi:hypothetical protein [Amycolatopsis sp.]|uniref:hypothetical protein n=1 Tax=Amycolatopsis sp. TaxID=37632 RepID=UPI002D7EC090|nr:hypothetical protein [Amycolatopsis sp.]HET6708517.1 hypothetical protein [Amycolatopsis sp.]